VGVGGPGPVGPALGGAAVGPLAVDPAEEPGAHPHPQPSGLALAVSSCPAAPGTHPARAVGKVRSLVVHLGDRGAPAGGGGAGGCVGVGAGGELPRSLQQRCRYFHLPSVADQGGGSLTCPCLCLPVLLPSFEPSFGGLLCDVLVFGRLLPCAVLGVFFSGDRL